MENLEWFKYEIFEYFDKDGKLVGKLHIRTNWQETFESKINSKGEVVPVLPLKEKANNNE